MTPSRKGARVRPFSFCVLVVLVLLASGCSFSPGPTPDASDTPTGLPTDTVLPSRTPTVTLRPGPTDTPTIRPTRTPTPLPGWVAEFADPVLQAIAGRAPDFQDDFSDPVSGWYNGVTYYGENLVMGEKSYVDGEYRTLAGSYPLSGEFNCSGVEDQNVGIYGDFVVEFDVRFYAGGDGDWQLQFHRWPLGQYVLRMGRTGDVNFMVCEEGQPGCSTPVTRPVGPVALGNAWNHVQLIVRGTTMAAYFNGIPYLYFDDTNAPEGARAGYFSLCVCNFSASPLEARWDNFRLWDISDLP